MPSSTLLSNVMEITRLPTAIFVPPTIDDQPNLCPLPPSLPTPIQIDRFLPFLDGYAPSTVRYLRDGFTAGFHLDYTGQLISVHSNNLSSAMEKPEAVDAKLNKELSAHRLAGPFSEPPFEKFLVSPLGVVPKKIPGEYRLIHHLSFPKGASVNDGISSEDSSVQYATIQDAITFVKAVGKDCFLAKTDIKNSE